MFERLLRNCVTKVLGNAEGVAEFERVAVQTDGTAPSNRLQLCIMVWRVWDLANDASLAVKIGSGCHTASDGRRPPSSDESWVEWIKRATVKARGVAAESVVRHWAQLH